MKLDLERLRGAAQGCARVEEKAEGFRFNRFTEEQEKVYEGTRFYGKVFSGAGIRLEFRTDSRHLRLEVDVENSTTRRFFSFDVFVNGKRLGELTNFPEEGVIYRENRAPAQIEAELGLFSGDFELGAGEKTVKIYFPWSVSPIVKSVIIDDGASFEPVKHSRRMLIFGDSITHGYDAVYPSNSYASIIADALDADARNKGIGGEVFNSALAVSKEDIEPDIITVAYGTNDWNCRPREDFEKSCTEFYGALSRLYPRARIFAITPIWRDDMDAVKPCGSFEHVTDFIIDTAKRFDNVIPVCGIEFVPHNVNYFSDFSLHPNDEGFSYYAKALLSEIIKYL